MDWLFDVGIVARLQSIYIGISKPLLVLSVGLVVPICEGAGIEYIGIYTLHSIHIYANILPLWNMVLHGAYIPY